MNSYKRNCFEAAFLCAREYQGFTPVVVHGLVRGQGPIQGIYHIHAWCEIGELVIDWTADRHPLVDRLYYSLGDISDDRLKKYSLLEASELIVEHGNYGPWEHHSWAHGRQAHCPSCKYFGVDCHLDPDEFILPCDAYLPG